MRASLRIARPLITAATILALIWLGRELAGAIPNLAPIVRRLGPWGLVVFLGAYTVLTALFVPMTLFAVPAGYYGGLLPGFLLVFAGSLIASAVMFALARRLLRSRIQRAIARRPRLRTIDSAVATGGLRLMILLRFTPVHFAVYNYLLGAREVSFRAYLLACLAMVPGNFLPVYIGYAAANWTPEGAPPELILWRRALLALGLGAAIAAIAFVARLARRQLPAD